MLRGIMNSKSAMVVDDSKSARFALRKSLEARGFVVEAVESAEEGYRHIAQSKPDIIFLDHVMPGIDGFTALRHIRAEHDSSSLPIVMCSSHDTSEFLQEATGLGANDVLVKPPSPEQLDGILSKLQKKSVAVEAVSTPGEATSTVVKMPIVGQRVMAAIRNTLTPAAPTPSVGTRPASNDIGAQIAELREQAAQLEAKLVMEQKAAEAAASFVADDSQNAVADLVQRMDAFESRVEAKLAAMQASIDNGLLMQSERILRVTEAARTAALENAHQEAERTVMQLVTNITDQFMNSLMSALRSGSFKPSPPSIPTKTSQPETIFRQKA